MIILKASVVGALAHRLMAAKLKPHITLLLISSVSAGKSTATAQRAASSASRKPRV